MTSNVKRIAAWVFALYCLLMLWLLFGRPGYDPSIPYVLQLKYNLIPFETIGRFLRLLDAPSSGLRTHAVINLAGNVIMFIPLGFFPPLLWPKLRRLWKTLLLCAGIIAAVEVLQLLTLVGSCDTDDLLLNLPGAAIGYGLFRLITKKQSPDR